MSDIPLPTPTTIEPLDESGGRALVEAWRSSGLNGAAYCRLHHLRPQRLHYWRERLGYPIKVVGDPGRTPIERPPQSEGFVQMIVGGTSSVPTTAVDIVVGDALIRVQAGFDARLLRSVVQALGTPS